MSTPSGPQPTPRQTPAVGGITYHPLLPDGLSMLPGAVPNPETIRLLQESFDRLAAQGEVFVERFYGGLFQRFPDLRPLFPEDMTAQRRKLLDTLSTVIESLRAPDMVRARLRDLGHRHTGYGARVEHYPLICSCLLEAMRDVSGADWSEELEREWSRAFDLISRIMMDGAAAAAGVPTTQRSV